MVIKSQAITANALISSCQHLVKQIKACRLHPFSSQLADLERAIP
jgi:hypothetical protein